MFRGFSLHREAATSTSTISGPVNGFQPSRRQGFVDENKRATKRLYDLRHSYATMSLAAGVSLFSLSRRMGTSVKMIDRMYGHLAPDAEAVELALLNAYDHATRAEPARVLLD